MSHFTNIHSELQRDAEAASKLTREAKRKTKMVRMTLQAFGALSDAMNARHDNWSVPKKRWKKAISKTMMENLCERFRKRVERMVNEGKLK